MSDFQKEGKTMRSDFLNLKEETEDPILSQEFMSTLLTPNFVILILTFPRSFRLATSLNNNKYPKLAAVKRVLSHPGNFSPTSTHLSQCTSTDSVAQPNTQQAHTP